MLFDTRSSKNRHFSRQTTRQLLTFEDDSNVQIPGNVASENVDLANPYLGS